MALHRRYASHPPSPLIWYSFVIFAITYVCFWAFPCCFLYLRPYSLFYFSFWLWIALLDRTDSFPYKNCMYLAGIDQRSLSPRLQRFILSLRVVFCISALRLVPLIAFVVSLLFSHRCRCRSDPVHPQTTSTTFHSSSSLPPLKQLDSPIILSFHVASASAATVGATSFHY
jgi:hypothetical protein